MTDFEKYFKALQVHSVDEITEQVPKRIDDSKKLASALAGRAKLLKYFLLDELKRQEKEQTAGKLYPLFDTFRNFVFHELTVEEFADTFAQSLIYGLFLAKLNADTQLINLYNAKKYIPASFELIRELVNFLDELDNDKYKDTKWIIEEVLTIMNNIDLKVIHESLSFTKNENVFDIEQGVAISFFIKRKGLEKKVFYTDFWGTRQDKYLTCLKNSISSVEWTEIVPKTPDYYFVPKNEQYKDEYDAFYSVTDIFKVYSLPLMTGNDKITVHFEENQKEENFTSEFRKYIDNLYGKGITPEQILGYIYAVLHSETYRKKYIEFLKDKFAKIPFTADKKLFVELSKLGTELMNVHLLKTDIGSDLNSYLGTGSDVVENVIYTQENEEN